MRRSSYASGEWGVPRFHGYPEGFYFKDKTEKHGSIYKLIRMNDKWWLHSDLYGTIPAFYKTKEAFLLSWEEMVKI